MTVSRARSGWDGRGQARPRQGFSRRPPFTQLRRRLPWVLICVLMAMATITAVVSRTEPVYRGVSTLSLLGRTLPPGFDPADIDRYALEYLRAAREDVLTPERMRRIDAGLQADPSGVSGAAGPGRVHALRTRIRTSVLAASMEPGDGDDPGSAAVTFRISVDDTGPDAAMGMIKAVEAAFLERHARSAAGPAIPPRQLEDAALEVERLAERIRVFEADIELFERRNAAALPELHERNVEALDRASRERLQLDDEIRVLEERRMELDRGLRDIQRGGFQPGRVPPGDDLTAERLIALQSERAVLRGRFGTAYPQVENLGGEIAAFQAAVKDRLDSAVSELQRSREELAALERVYPIDHPDVVRASHRVSALEARVEQLNVRGLTSGEQRYIESVSRERREIDGRIEALRAQRQSLQESVTDYEARALERPALEQQYVRLRDKLAAAHAELDRARGHAQTLAAQQHLAEQLRPGRLAVVAPAAVVGPLLLSRPGVVAMLGVAFASLAIILVVALLERVDRRVSGSGAIERLIGRPPLADIPFIPVPEGSAARALPESIPVRLGVTVFIGVTAALLLAGVAADGLERVVLSAGGP